MNRPGSSAPRCGFVFYLDPKIAVGTIIRATAGGIVLVRRAIEPGYGKWVFPGGYVDRGEPLTTRRNPRSAGRVRARRAARRTGQHLLRTRAARRSSSCMPRQRSAAPLLADDECLETAEFTPESIPWEDFAFPSTRDGLRDYLAGLLHPVSSNVVSSRENRTVDSRRLHGSVARCQLCNRSADARGR